MSDPSDRLGEFLPGMSWISEVEKEGRLVARKRQARRQTAKVIASPQTIIQLIAERHDLRDFHEFSVSCRDAIFPRLLCFGTADYSDCADRSAQSASSAADFPHYWACPVANRVQLLCHDDLVEASKEMHLDPYIDEEILPSLAARALSLQSFTRFNEDNRVCDISPGVSSPVFGSAHRGPATTGARRHGERPDLNGPG